MSFRKPGGTSSCLPHRGLDHPVGMDRPYLPGPRTRPSTSHLRITLNSPLINPPNCFLLSISRTQNNCWPMAVRRQRRTIRYVHLEVNTDNSQPIKLDTTCSWIRIIWTRSSPSRQSRTTGCRLIRAGQSRHNLCQVRRWDTMGKVMGIYYLSNRVNMLSLARDLHGGDVVALYNACCILAYGFTSAKSASPLAPLIPFRTPVVSRTQEVDLHSSAIFFLVSTSAEPI